MVCTFCSSSYPEVIGYIFKQRNSDQNCADVQVGQVIFGSFSCNAISVFVFINPIALRKAKTLQSFGLSKWNRVK